ncbi:MAG: hypothetical protein ACYTBW_03280 [Planctomycetota bacterium]|jgi:hypothetical protein
MTKAAFENRPDPSSVLPMIEIAKRIPGLRTMITADLQSYVDNFVQHKDDYQKHRNKRMNLQILPQLLEANPTH